MVAFTKAGLTELTGVRGLRLVVRDPRTPGLLAELRKGGTVSFSLFKRRKGGGPVRVSLGRFPEVSVEQARRQAAKALAELASGGDPAARQRANRKSPTLGELFEQYLLLPTRTRSKRTKAAETVYGYRNQFQTHLKHWSNRKIAGITRAEVEKLHNLIGTTVGHYAANRILSLIKAMLNHAVDCGHIGTNPASRIAAYAEESRQRFLQANELPKFWAAVESEPCEKLRDVVKLLLLTGQRVGNVSSMKWQDVDLAGGLWRIPQTKTGRHEVPLLPEAVAILAARKALNGSSEFVFPAAHRKTHFAVSNTAWKELLQRAGIEGLRLHDLRRTHASWAAITGSSLPVIGRVLGHSQAATTQVYARLADAPVRAAMATSVATMMALAKQGSTD